MGFFNFDLFGVYVAPMAFVLLACWAVWLLVRRLLDAVGVVSLIWHPALFFAGLYAVMASSAVLFLLQRPLFLNDLFGVYR